MRVRELDLVVEADATAARVHALDRAAVEAARHAERATLRVASLAGDVVALGRHHRRPAGGGDVAVARRHGAGRVAAVGAGFVSIAVHLPHRAALVADTAEAIAPAQVLNRVVRGLLGALDALGVASSYPGRDLVTARGRAVAVLGFDVADDGVTVVDAVLSLARDQAILPRLLDRVDAAGAAPAAMIDAREVTCVAAEIAAAPSLDEVVTALRRGFRARLDVDVGAPAVGLVVPEVDHEAWLETRRVRRELDRRARVPTRLGTLEVDLAVRGDALIAVQVCGDVLVSADAVARLERALTGAPLDAAVVRATVCREWSPPRGYLLGVSSPDVVADAIVAAATR